MPAAKPRSARDQVKDALDRAWAINEELKAARKDAQDARNFYNELKGRQDSAELREQGEADLARVVAQHASHRDQAVAVAQDQLNLATDEFHRASQEAEAVFGQLSSAASDLLVQKLKEAEMQLTVQAAEAHSQAREAQQKADALAASLDRYKGQVRTDLGVDLSGLLETL